MDETLQIRFKLYVCELEEEFSLMANIRHVETAKQEKMGGRQLFRTGTEFQITSRYHKVLIHDYVMEQKFNVG